MKSKWIVALVVALLLMGGDGFAQKTKKSTKKTPAKTTTQKKPTTQPTQKPAATKTKETAPPPAQAVTTTGAPDEEKVKDIINFLQYVLNTLGSDETSSRDKDVLITESYTKIFRDAKVQIEDDLDEDRKVITNKDVVAYLKDVDFFFNNVKFEFIIEDIKSSTLPTGELFYKVSLRRNLTGTSADGATVNNTKPRFVEINFNPKDQDLKIVSIYTRPFDETAALTAWWSELSYEWKSIFRKKLNLGDSVSIENIKSVTSIPELDLSSNGFIKNIEPLGQLVGLKVLNLSYTGIDDLTPIRNLTELVELDLSNTKVLDLTPLRYSIHLQRLNISNTEVSDLTPLEKMQKLQNLQMSSVPVFEFNALGNFKSLKYLDMSATSATQLLALENLTMLQELNISKTLVSNVTPLQKLTTLTVLTIDSTRIRDLQPVSSLVNLTTLSANYTQVDNLMPLAKLPKLERVYCDQTLVKRESADAFTSANRKALVIFDSKDLLSWWSTLPESWKMELSESARISTTPSKEELAKVTVLDSINFSGRTEITTLEPLQKLPGLQVLIADHSGIADLSPLEQHRSLRKLDISQTNVSDIFVVRQFQKLTEFRADETKIENIDALLNVPGLKKVYVDRTAVHDIIAQEFLEKNPSCLLVYKTIHLDRWWNEISDNWKNIFRPHFGGDTTVTREKLHRITQMQSFEFRDVPVSDLNIFREFIRLTSLKFSGTAVSIIPALDNFRSLRVLHAQNGPLQHIGAVSLFKNLTELDISNTPVDELKPVSGLGELKTLNAGGTQVKKLDPLEGLGKLEMVDCSNTRVSSLGPLEKLNLKSLKCYNSKVSSREVDKFKERKPDCNVVYYR